jgi:hypothetical protein
MKAALEIATACCFPSLLLLPHLRTRFIDEVGEHHNAWVPAQNLAAAAAAAAAAMSSAVSTRILSRMAAVIYRRYANVCLTPANAVLTATLTHCTGKAALPCAGTLQPRCLASARMQSTSYWCACRDSTLLIHTQPAAPTRHKLFMLLPSESWNMPLNAQTHKHT